MGRGRGTEKKNTGGIIGRGYTTTLSLLGSFAYAKPRRPFNERNLLFAGSSTCTCYETTRCSAYDSRSGLVPPSCALSHSLYLFLCRRHASTTGTLEWPVFCDTRILRSLGERTTPSMFLLVSPILLARGVQSRRNARPRGITSAEARRAGNTSVAIILSTGQLIFRLLPLLPLLYSSIRTIFMLYVALFLDWRCSTLSLWVKMTIWRVTVTRTLLHGWHTSCTIDFKRQLST